MIAVLQHGTIRQCEGVAPFDLDVAAATAYHDRLIAVGAVLSTTSWTPRRTDEEWLSVHPAHLTPAISAVCQALGMSGNDRAGYSLLVQKCAWWPRDRYARLSDEEQARADRLWIDAGGWLSEDQLKRLQRYGW